VYHHVVPSSRQIGTSRRDQILEAALACFLASSVAGTTVDDLRRRSGASVGSIYHFFGSKERLAAELYLDTLSSYQTSFLDTLHTSRTARAGVEGVVRHHLRWVADRPDRASYLFHCREPEVTAASEQGANTLNERFYQQASDWLAGHVQHGHIRSLPPKLYHALWMGPALEFARLWLAGRRRRSELLTAARPLAEAAWNTLRPR
jgi:AcrR family transcriptional regulator